MLFIDSYLVLKCVTEIPPRKCHKSTIVVILVQRRSFTCAPSVAVTIVDVVIVVIIIVGVVIVIGNVLIVVIVVVFIDVVTITIISIHEGVVIDVLV